MRKRKEIFQIIMIALLSLEACQSKVSILSNPILPNANTTQEVDPIDIKSSLLEGDSLQQGCFKRMNIHELERQFEITGKKFNLQLKNFDNSLQINLPKNTTVEELQDAIKDQTNCDSEFILNLVTLKKSRPLADYFKDKHESCDVVFKFKIPKLNAQKINTKLRNLDNTPDKIGFQMAYRTLDHMYVFESPLNMTVRQFLEIIEEDCKCKAVIVVRGELPKPDSLFKDFSLTDNCFGLILRPW